MTAARDAIKRFTVSDRIEHWVQMVAFVVLAVTGLIQRYSRAWISEKLVDGLGGVETVRDIHRVFATVLMIAVVYHYGGAFYRRYVQRQPRAMLPSGADLKAIKASMKYVFRGAGEAPPQGRFTWEEKVEYWSLVWGTVLMIITGYMLWNPIATTRFLPGQVVPAAKAAHGGEAVLALLAIVVWHTYHVHIRHSNKSMFSGKMSRHEMEEYHPLELMAIDRGGHASPQGDELRARVQRFATIFGISAVVLLGAVYLFVTFEETAIETIEPAEQIAVYAPIETLAPGSATTTDPTSPTTTSGPDAPGADATWHGQIAPLLERNCTICHGTNIQSAGLDLSTYAGALAGGESGAGVVPGNAAGSEIVKIQEAGGHFQQLSENEIAGVRGWIDAGAEEGDAAAPPTSGAVDWDGVISGMLDPSCTGCHGTGLQSGGLDLSSYAATVAGGVGGAGVVPGDSAGSVLFQVQDAGGHAGQLSADDVAVLAAWIDAGAAESGGSGGAPPSAGGTSWDGSVAALLDPSCTGCHGAGMQSGGLDLSSYAAAVAGGTSGAGVVSGDSAGSVLVQVQEDGGHPGQLSADDLAVVIAWIDAGAAESGGGGETPPAAGGESWDGAVAAVFDLSCAGCHGAGVQSGGVDLSSYSTAVAVIVPGDASASVIVQVMEAGGHPGRLSDKHLALVKDWIDSGAAESDGGGATPPVAAGATWNADIAGMFDPSCTACHGANLQSGGLDLTSYSAVLAGGGRGASVLPGDAAGSVLVQILEAGGHPAQLPAEDLALLKEWIDAGADEG